METLAYIAAWSSWIWQPAMPPQRICGAAGVLGILAVAAYARSMRQAPRRNLALLAMRLVAISALAVLLMGPSQAADEARDSARPTLAVLVDTSRSMRVADCGGAGRLAFAQRTWLTRPLLAELAGHYNVRLMGLDESLRPLGESALRRPADELATGGVTHLAECIRQALGAAEAGTSATGDARTCLLVLSDGADSDDAPLAPLGQLARARGVPVHTVCLGGPAVQPDLFLLAVPQQQYLLAGETGHILAEVHQVGLPNAETVVRLDCQGQTSTFPVRFQGQDVVPLRLPIRRDQPGPCECRVSVDPVPGETQTANNTQAVFMEVTAGKIKVLLLEGQPFWDTKFIAQSLRKDPRIELTQVWQVAADRQQRIVSRKDAAVAGVPASVGEWAEYNVVILGRGIEKVLPPAALRLLAGYVSGGGGRLVFARGRPYDAETPEGRQAGRDLAVLEPVVWGRDAAHNLSLSLTPAGRVCPCFTFAGPAANVDQTLSRLPGFDTMPAVIRGKAATVVLAQAVPAGRAGGPANPAAEEAPPAIVSMDFGRGTVFAVLGEGLWRWSFLPPELAGFDGVYDSFWSNTVRWLAMGGEFLPGQELAFRLGATSVRLGDPAMLEVVWKLPPPEAIQPRLTVIDPLGTSQGVALEPTAVPTRRQASYAAKAPGTYRAVLEVPSSQPASQPARLERKFSVYHVDREAIRCSARPEELRALAELSGGTFLRPDRPGDLPAELARLRAQSRRSARPSFVWDRFAVLIVLLTWAGVEWIARRKAGML
jgi:hypothetical protein